MIFGLTTDQLIDIGRILVQVITLVATILA